MESEQPFPRQRLEKEFNLAEQKLLNLRTKRKESEEEVQETLKDIQSLEQTLNEKKRRLIYSQQSLQSIRSKIDQVEKIKRLLIKEMEKSEEERKEESKQRLEAEQKRREEGKYAEIEGRVFQEILKDARARTRRQSSEKQESAFLRSTIPIAVHDRIEKLGENEKVNPDILIGIIDELAFQYNLLQNLPQGDQEEDIDSLRTLNQAGIGFLAFLKILGLQEGHTWDFQKFVNDLEGSISKTSTTYYAREGFTDILDIEEISYSIDSHIAAVCTLIDDQPKNKIYSALEPLRISIEERLGSILKQLDSSKKIFLNDLFREAVLKNKLFSSGSVEGIADLGKIRLEFSDKEVFGKNTAEKIDEIQKKLDVISLAIAEIFLEEESVRKVVESRLS